MFFFEIRKIEPFPGSPFSDHFWRLFFEKFCIALFLGKILVANYRIVCEVNFAPKAQNFSTDIRKSAVLDAVLEDKPAQPLPCGSYLVVGSKSCVASNFFSHLKGVLRIVVGEQFWGVVSCGHCEYRCGMWLHRPFIRR